MAKDPAVLFYTSDFLSGTAFFNDEQKGQYITLLCQQHQLGSIPENHMIYICKSLDSPVVKKFIKDNSGNYYNERMRSEGEKRANYCKSRGLNKEGHFKNKIISKSYENHMEDDNENGNEDINNKGKRFLRPTLDQVKNYCKETGSKIDPEVFFHNYESTDWVKANGQKVKNWKSTIKTWEKRNLAKEELKPKKKDHEKIYRENQEYLRKIESGEL